MYDEVDFYIAILIYINARGYKIPKANIELLGVDIAQEKLQLFNQEWAEKLLQPLLLDYRKQLVVTERLQLLIPNCCTFLV